MTEKHHILVDILSQMTALTKEEAADIAMAFPIVTMPKGAFLLKEKQVAVDAYFVVKGCVRAYRMVDGEEQTLNFFTEQQSAANFKSLAHQVPSDQNFICTEETVVAIVNAEKEAELYQRYPRFETFCRAGMEKMLGDQQGALLEFMALDPEARYLKLLNERPDLINRVPQYQLASYLGIKPETLSRIRKRIFK